MKTSSILGAISALEKVKSATQIPGPVDATIASELWLACIRAAIDLRVELCSDHPQLRAELDMKEAA